MTAKAALTYTFTIDKRDVVQSDVASAAGSRHPLKYHLHTIISLPSGL